MSEPCDYCDSECPQCSDVTDQGRRWTIDREAILGPLIEVDMGPCIDGFVTPDVYLSADDLKRMSKALETAND